MKNYIDNSVLNYYKNAYRLNPCEEYLNAIKAEEENLKNAKIVNAKKEIDGASEYEKIIVCGQYQIPDLW